MFECAQGTCEQQHITCWGAPEGPGHFWSLVDFLYFCTVTSGHFTVSANTVYLVRLYLLGLGVHQTVWAPELRKCNTFCRVFSVFVQFWPHPPLAPFLFARAWPTFTLSKSETSLPWIGNVNHIDTLPLWLIASNFAGNRGQSFGRTLEESLLSIVHPLT